jgi:hypothetical protein
LQAWTAQALRPADRHLVIDGEKISTLRKRGVALLAALETLFTGQPLYPSFA